MNLNFLEVIKSGSLAKKLCMGLILSFALSPAIVYASVSASQQKEKSVQSTSAVQKRLDTLYGHLAQPDDLAAVFYASAKKHHVDPKLLVSMCVTESHFRKRVVNRGAVGMCQIIPRYHATTKSDMMNYRKNVDKAAEIIADLKSSCRNNVKCIVHSYNVGKYAYLKGVRCPAYYAKVMKQYRRTV